MAVSYQRATDWRDDGDYVFLLEADRRMFAWEWLRRNQAYRRAWQRYGARAVDRIAERVARHFGLAALEDPSLDARSARPVWHAECDPHVIVTAAAKGSLPRSELFDILRLGLFANVAIDAGGNEQWLLSDGRWLLRIDVVEGTLLGGPALLRYRLEGMAKLPPRLESLGQLVALESSHARAGPPLRPERKASRWIAELRAADALGEGASQRQIAQHLFGKAANSSWRVDNDAYRLRVQRLARTARARLASPLSREWFR